MSYTNDFDRLYRKAGEKKMDVVLPLVGQGKKRTLRIEVRFDGKVIDYEIVKNGESVNKAARRVASRMNKEGFFA